MSNDTQTRRGWRKLVAGGLAALMAATILTTIAPAAPAEANARHMGYQHQWGATASSIVAMGTTVAADGTPSICVEPGRENTGQTGMSPVTYLPSYSYTASGMEFGGNFTFTVPAASGSTLATLNYLATLAQDPGTNLNAAALEGASWIARFGGPGNVPVGPSSFGANIVQWHAHSATGNRNIGTNNLADSIWNQAVSFYNTARSVVGNGLPITTNAQPATPATVTNNETAIYRGTATFSASGFTSATITNGVFVANGQSTINFTTAARLGGATLEWRGTGPAGTKYPVVVRGTWDTRSIGQGLRISSNPSDSFAQRLASPLGATGTASFTYDDPFLGFSPELSTSATRFLEEGDRFSDSVTFRANTSASKAPYDDQWSQYIDGSYYEVTARGTLYGPYAAQPERSSTVPAGAPVATTATVTTGAQGPTVTYDVTSAQTSREAGFYTWVWEIREADQNLDTQERLADGYRYADDFGLWGETQIDRTDVEFSTRLSTSTVKPGDTFSDTITPAITDTMLIDRTTGEAFPIPLRGYLYHSATQPTQRATVPAGATLISDQYTATLRHPTNPVRVDDILAPANRTSGWLTMVWCVDTTATLYADAFCDDYGVPAETARIELGFTPYATTAAPRFVTEGQRPTDVVTFAANTGAAAPYNGAWPTDASGNRIPVIAQGTLYGPFTREPTEAASVPANVPVAGTATITTGNATSYTATADQPVTAPGYYTWVWQVRTADQAPATASKMRPGYAWADRFGLTAETSIVKNDPSFSTQLDRTRVIAGGTFADTITPTMTDPFLRDRSNANIPIELDGTVYWTAQQPTRRATVPAGAEVVGRYEATLTSTGAVTVTGMRAPDKAGYLTVVWCVDTAASPTANAFCDDFGVPSETAQVVEGFSPELVSQAPVYINEGQTFTDQLRFSANTAAAAPYDNAWPRATDGSYLPVLAQGVLYGPFDTRPVESATVPSGAPIAATATLTTSGQNGPTVAYNVDSRFVSSEAGYYNWVWTIRQAAQASDTRFAMAPGYVFADRFGLRAETSIDRTDVMFTTQVDRETVQAGDRFADTITPQITDTILDGSVQLRGTMYYSATQPVRSATVPQNAVVVNNTLRATLTSKTTPVTVTGITAPNFQTGYLTLVWCVDTAASPNAEAFCDDYGIPAETVRYFTGFTPQLVTRAPEYLAEGQSFTDDVTFAANTAAPRPYNGTWPTGQDGRPVAVTATGTLYGPFDQRPAEAATVPTGAPVAATARLTTGAQGPAITYTADSRTESDRAGYYTWVWRIDASQQSAEARALIRPSYAWADRFGIPAETTIDRTDVSFSTQLDRQSVIAGGRFADVITPNISDAMLRDFAGRTVPINLDGTVYYSAERPVQSATVPAGAEVVGRYEARLTNATSPVTVRDMVAPTKQGWLTVVWCVDTAATPTADAFCDQYGVPAETAEVVPGFSPELVSEAPEFIEEGDTFTDRLRFSADRDAAFPYGHAWPQHSDGSYFPVVAQGVLYGPFTNKPVEDAEVPAGAPVAARATVTTDTQYGPGVDYDIESGFVSSEAGYYNWVWTIRQAAQPDAYTALSLPTGYVFADAFGLAAETSVDRTDVEFSTQLDRQMVISGGTFADTITPDFTDAVLDGTPIELDGTVYYSATRPVQSSIVPADAVAVGTYEARIADGSTAVTVSDMVAPTEQGWLTVVWCVDTASSPSAEAFCDDYGVPAETAEVVPGFTPELTTEAPAYIAEGDTFTDEVRFAADTEAAAPYGHAWPQHANGDFFPVLADGVLYGPFTNKPVEDAEVPADAPVAATAQITTTAEQGPGIVYAADSGFVAETAGYYSWVWTIRQADQQDAHTALALAPGYVFADAFGLAAETSVDRTDVEFSTQLDRQMVIAGGTFADTITPAISDPILDGEPIALEGTVYHSATRPEQSATVPADASPVGTYRAAIVDGIEPVVVADMVAPVEQGWLTVVWCVDTITSPTAEAFCDDYGVPAETAEVVPGFTPELVSQAPQFIEEGEVFTDQLRFDTADGAAFPYDHAWARHADGSYYPVVAQGTLYGPFTHKPAEDAEVPADAPVAARATLTTSTVDGPERAYEIESDFVSDVAGYYNWVWTIRQAAQPDAHTALALEPGYVFADRFGLDAETSIDRTDVLFRTQLDRDEIAPGNTFSDTITPEFSDPVLDGGHIDLDGTVYWTAERPEQSTAVPAGAEPVGTYEARLTDGAEPVVVEGMRAPHTEGWITVVWCVDTASSPTAEAFCDDFGVPAETARIAFPEARTEAQPASLTFEAFTDTAIIDGEVPVGTELSFALYRQPIADEAKVDESGRIVRDEAGRTVRWTAEEIDAVGAAELCLAQPVFDTSSTPLEITGPGSYESAPYTALEPGTYHWVETLTYPGADGREAFHVGECGIPNERTVVTEPTVTTLADTDLAVFDEVADTAIVEGSVPAGSLLWFDLYRAAVAGEQKIDAEGKGIVDEAGAPVLWTADEVAAAAEGADERALPAEEHRQLVFTTREAPLTIDEPGEYRSAAYTAPLEGTYYWVETLAHEHEGEIVEMHRGEYGIANETSTVTEPTVTTTAQAEAVVGKTAHDVAHIEGLITENPDIAVAVSFAAYRQTSDVATCTAETLYAETAPVAVTAGDVRSPDIDIRDAGVYYWVETLTWTNTETGDSGVWHVGECGLENERTIAKLPLSMLDNSATNLAPIGAGIAGLLLLLGLALGARALRRRRSA